MLSPIRLSILYHSYTFSLHCALPYVIENTELYTVLINVNIVVFMSLNYGACDNCLEKLPSECMPFVLSPQQIPSQVGFLLNKVDLHHSFFFYHHPRKKKPHKASEVSLGILNAKVKRHH